MKKILFVLLLLISTSVFAADYEDGGRNKNNDMWLQFALIRVQNTKQPFGNKSDNMLEIEYGGRLGIVDYYGFTDFFDIDKNSGSDRNDRGDDDYFYKFNPRFSVDGTFKKDLSIGPVQEWYLATQAEGGDNEKRTYFIGVGTDLKVPWFGKVKLNLYARRVDKDGGSTREDTWDGYRINTSWFKPLHQFENGTSLVYKGFADFDFGMDDYTDGRSSTSIQWSNELYWITPHISIGYELRVYDNFTGIDDGSDFGGYSPRHETSGIGHMFAFIYKI